MSSFPLVSEPFRRENQVESAVRRHILPPDASDERYRSSPTSWTPFKSTIYDQLAIRRSTCCDVNGLHLAAATCQNEGRADRAPHRRSWDRRDLPRSAEITNIHREHCDETKFCISRVHLPCNQVSLSLKSFVTQPARLYPISRTFTVHVDFNLYFRDKPLAYPPIHPNVIRSRKQQPRLEDCHDLLVELYLDNKFQCSSTLAASPTHLKRITMQRPGEQENIPFTVTSSTSVMVKTFRVAASQCTETGDHWDVDFLAQLMRTRTLSLCMTSPAH